MFFKKRNVPATPSSLVNDAAWAAGVTHGESISAPNSDHVPLER